MDIRIQTLSHELKLKTQKEQELNTDLKERIGRNKELEEEVTILKAQNFKIQEEARKLDHALQSVNRELTESQRNR